MSRRGCTLVCLFALALGSCRPAGQFNPINPRAAENAKSDAATNDKHADAELPIDLEWEDNAAAKTSASLPLVYVSEAQQPELWAKLKTFWNEPAALKPDAPAGDASERVIHLKVPLGLPDPAPFLPANYSPTLAKWELGRELFFGSNYLVPTGVLSCATCHEPAQHFADKAATHNDYNAPALVNSLYNRQQFWDGRARNLEECVQQTLDDERDKPENDGRRHVWGGVIHRLRDNEYFASRFRQVFGTLPTQENLGEALAVYLRTLLSGNSILDRARVRQKTRGSKLDAELEAGDFEAVLSDADLATMDRKDQSKPGTAAMLERGAQLFFKKAECLKCHGGPLFTDQGYHNLGIGLERFKTDREFDRAGRFAQVPLGEKTRSLIGAFKTPTLRGVGRTVPYFHNGEAKSLEEVVRRHAVGGNWNRFLDPLLIEGGQPGGPRSRVLPLSDVEIAELALFLRALDGDPVADAVRAPK